VFKDSDICFVVPWSFGTIYAENENKKCSDCTTGYLRWFQVSKSVEVLHCTNILVRKCEYRFGERIYRAKDDNFVF